MHRIFSFAGSCLLLLPLLFAPGPSGFVAAQQQTVLTKTIEWTAPEEISISLHDVKRMIHFKGVQYIGEYPEELPWFISTDRLPSDGAVTGELQHVQYIPLTPDELKLVTGIRGIGEEPRMEVHTVYERKQPFVQLHLLPLRKKDGRYEKIASFELRLLASPSMRQKSGPKAASVSVLASGNWFKVGITSSGIYKISKSLLTSMGMSTAVDPRNIRLYGNGGRQLPERNSEYYPDDLAENAIYVSGEQDGVFNDNDFILFYAQGPVAWRYDPVRAAFRHSKNIYADTAWYFITADAGPGKRITTQAQKDANPTHTVSEFDDYGFIENDEENLIKSGRRWVGNRMELTNSVSFSLSFPNITNGPHKLISCLAGRHHNTNPAQPPFLVNINGQTFQQSVPGTDIAYYLATYARDNESVFTFNTSSPTINMTVTRQSNGIGWVDYLTVNVKRNLIFGGAQLAFRNHSVTGIGNVAEYILSNAGSEIKIWEVTNRYDVREQLAGSAGNTLTFKATADSLREFVALNPSGSFSSPIAGGRVANQNLHATAQVDMIIVSPPQFRAAVDRLAGHHRNRDGLRVAVVSPAHIYNEFSSGSQDISAIRNFVRMFYSRATSPEDLPKYLLLAGDASYDPKYRLPNNTNLIPVYQSVESFAPLSSFASDDFFGFLDENEGSGIETPNGGLLDIGIGRFPCTTADEANGIVQKIIHYVTSRSCMNDWRNTLCFIADDEDNNTHQEQAETVSNIIKRKRPVYNVDKVYLDAFQQLSGSAGQRYPEVNMAITNRVERGALVMNYAGHGGEQSLALERIVTIPEINGWRNMDNLTFFITATCEFARFDDPGFVSAGEYVLLNPAGAGVGLFTTTRLTFSSSNRALNSNIMDTIFGIRNNRHLTLGEILRFGKNKTGNSFNNRNFSLLGDPAMRLAFPLYNVVTETVNAIPVTSPEKDTLNALEKVTITGFIADAAGNPVTSFNGVIIPTVFDKPRTYLTLSNDGQGKSPVMAFDMQKSVIFKGPATVKDGRFMFQFVVPQDIQYHYGYGKLSYYARHNSTLEDAAGSYDSLMVGGFSQNPVSDNEGPKIRLYMNNEQFVSGGMTDEHPDLLAYVEDDIGINTVGTGVGHDITAVLDGNTSQPVILNDYYEAAQDDYRRGKIVYPFRNLPEGPHTLTLKVWDVSNNSAEAVIEFVVVKNEELALDRVLNYPNPFTTRTQFFFEYNQPGIPVDVDIHIYTIAGRLVKRLESTMQTNGFRSEPIAWDGLDDFGDKIGRGVYVYRLRVKTPEGKIAEKFEKLVILN